MCRCIVAVAAGFAAAARAGVVAVAVICAATIFVSVAGRRTTTRLQRTDWRRVAARSCGDAADAARIVVTPSSGRRRSRHYAGALPQLPAAGVAVAEVVDGGRRPAPSTRAARSAARIRACRATAASASFELIRYGLPRHSRPVTRRTPGATQARTQAAGLPDPKASSP